MKNKTMEKLQIALMVLATIVLIVVNVFTFDPITLGVLRVVFVSCWVGVWCSYFVDSKMKTQKTEEG